MGISNDARSASNNRLDRYSWRFILLIWLAATLPMVLLTWIAIPWIINRTGLPASLTFFFLSSLGMFWQGAFALLMLRREAPQLTPDALRRRLWLTAPSKPKTGQRRRRAYILVVPLFGVAALFLLLANVAVSAVAVSALKFLMFLRDPFWARFFPGYAKSLDLMSPELAGQWWVVLAVPSVALLAIMSEELLFRGLLLPKMSGRVGWLGNALLSALHYVYVPWMIPSRLIATTGAVWAARRYRSNRIPLLVRLNEVIGLTAAAVVGCLSFAFPPLDASTSLPHLVGCPPARKDVVQRLEALPICNPKKAFSVDLRSKDVSALDLRGRARDLDCALFNDHTVWPASDRLPAGFDSHRILEASKNPGLRLGALHAQGITGRGVGIGMIDSPLLAEHEEFADRLRWYEEIPTMGLFQSRPEAEMHGTTMASIAVGRTTGVAPEADLYFIAQSAASFSPTQALMLPHFFAQRIRRLVEINRLLPADRKIRVISLSQGWGAAMLGSHDAEAAVTAARAEGIAFFSVTHHFCYGGLARRPLSDPDSFEDHTAAWLWRQGPVWQQDRPGRLLKEILFSIPNDNRTLASETGAKSFAYHFVGGASSGPPFVAGLYALAVQVDPTITPERFLELAACSARNQQASENSRQAFRVVDPEALIVAVREAKVGQQASKR